MAYEVMDKSIEDDSDSDFEPHSARLMGDGRNVEGAMANLNLNTVAASPPKQPPRPMVLPPKPPVVRKQPSPEPESENDEEDDDADNPFADSYAVKTPAVEKSGMRW